METRQRIKCFWWSIQFISSILSGVELYLSLSDASSKHLAKVLYHIFQIISKSGSIVITYVCSTKSAELTMFLNCVYKRNSSPAITSSGQRIGREKSLNSKFFVVLTYLVAISGFLFLGCWCHSLH